MSESTTPTLDKIRADFQSQERAKRQAQADAIDSHESTAPAFHVIELSRNEGYCVTMGMHDEIRVDGRKFSVGITFTPSRRVIDGPIVDGPHAWLNQKATVISAHPMPLGKVYRVELGDVLVLGGTLWKIEQNPRAHRSNSDYLQLVRVELTAV